ncbi:glucose-inhibited division protein A [Marinilactibacillus sp. 15R]|uniref:FAD-dependent oxidoreductase n=1 Tax=Marinilactibacillus sp. 15R TaxID=1911586 RepID=UPI00090B1854|nr:FAD-dependent oxidoreductase [Marinilactibacillus sp. 15R]API88994.1 glucose-inhibited division protein A [Marinilactibacillus sp. 15R]
MFDVIVLGGGFSGSITGIAAARSGAKTLVIENGAFFGGSLTSNGVGPMMTFHAGDKQVVQGIADELITRLKEQKKSPGHIFDTTGFTYTVTPFDAEAMKHELELMLVESGGKPLYHAQFVEAVKKDKNIQSIKVYCKGQLLELDAKVFVDATGDAIVAASAGIPLKKGRDSDSKNQPMTLTMRVINVDIEKVKEYARNHPEEFPRYTDMSILDKGDRLSIAGFTKLFDEAKKRGEISIPREDILFFETNNKGEVIMNTTRIIDLDPTDPWDYSEAEFIGRKQCRELEQFLKKYIPGFENSMTISTGPTVGIRSSRQIKGVYTLTLKDLLEKKKFKDTIAHCGYPVDIHSPDGEGTESNKPQWGDTYNIPYSISVTNEIDNLIVSGRAVSATFEAQSAIRTTPTVGAVGHALGIAAALSAANNVSVRDIDIKEVQQKLVEQGAYLDI